MSEGSPGRVSQQGKALEPEGAGCWQSLGKIICISDPEEANRRDEHLLALRQQSAQAGLSLPSFRPGLGLFLEGDPLAGQLFLQREVAKARGDGSTILSAEAFV